jgi:HAD superfamily hydrolase (TIGR01509 family)
MSKRFDAVVFDMDGLMFDTEHLFFRVADEFMTGHGRRFTESMMAAMIGRRAEEAGKVFHTMGGLTDRPVVEIMSDVKSLFYQRMLTDSNKMPGLVELLEMLASLNIPKSVATSSSRSHAESLIGHHGILEHFQFLVTSEDVNRGKPDPEIYLKSARQLKIDPSRILVLEDSVAGLHAAKSAGAFAVGVPHKFSPIHGMDHADMIIQSLQDPALFRLFA